MEVKCLDAWVIYLGEINKSMFKGVVSRNVSKSISQGAATKLRET